jgi:hypothetical protein
VDRLSAGPGCRAIVAAVPDYVDLELVHLSPGRLWWGVSTAAEYGGTDSQFGTAGIGPGCAVSEPRAITGFPALDWADGSFAVDAGTVYLGGRDSGGIVSAPAG